MNVLPCYSTRATLIWDGYQFGHLKIVVYMLYKLFACLTAQTGNCCAAKITAYGFTIMLYVLCIEPQGPISTRDLAMFLAKPGT